jgi:hypothetical protein
VKYFSLLIPILGSISAALQTMPYSVAGYAVGYILIASLYKTSDVENLSYGDGETLEANKDEQV